MSCIGNFLDLLVTTSLQSEVHWYFVTALLEIFFFMCITLKKIGKLFLQFLICVIVTKPTPLKKKKMCGKKDCGYSYMFIVLLSQIFGGLVASVF